MTKFCLLFILLSIQLHASVYSQQDKITLKFNHISVKNLFIEIEKLSDYAFVYKLKDVIPLQELSVDFKNTEISKILDHCLKGTDLGYKIESKHIIIIRNDKKKDDKNVVIKGKVVDEKGTPLPGVSVVIKGTSVGVATDIKGQFSINVPKMGETLIISFIGMEKKEVVVKKTNLTVTLKELRTSLDDVVVIGYGSVKKKDLTGAVGVMDTKLIEESTAVSVAEMIQGQIPGVEISTGSGAPGEESQIRIRGTASIMGNNNPLIVIDDVPMPEDYSLNSLSPMDIKSLSVLKGASSAAIYGSRGAAGVIVITTRRGERGRKARINYKFSRGSEELTSDIRSLSSEELKMIFLEAVRNTARARGYYQTIDKDKTYRDMLAGKFFGEADTNWAALMLQDAYTDNHQIDISGGGKTTSYRSSLSFNKTEGMVIGSENQRINFSLNADSDISKKLKLRVSVRYGENKRKTPGASMSNVILNRPDIPAFNDDGSYYIHYKDSWNGKTYMGNPLIELNNVSKSNTRSINISANLEYKLYKDLRAEGSVAYSRSDSESNRYTTSQAKACNGSWTKCDGMATFSTRYNTKKRLEGRLNYSKHINNHSINAMFSGSYSEDFSQNWGIKFKDFADDFVQNHIWQGSKWDIQGTNGRITTSALASFVARVNYTMFDKYLITGTYRMDGSSRLSPDVRWGKFPSAAFSWVLSEEKWLKREWLPFLKLRFSWGETGMGYVGEYSWRTLFNQTTYNGHPGIIPGQISNDELEWESTTQYDLGLDFGFFKGRRINGSAGLYQKDTDGLMYSFTLAPSTGCPSTKVNYASVQNKGIELDLNIDIVRNKNFRWTVGATWSKNFNEVKDIDGDYVSYPGSTYISNSVMKSGEPLGLIFGFKSEGIFRTMDQVNEYEGRNDAHYYQTDMDGRISQPGDIILSDLNGDGYVNIMWGEHEDKCILGRSRPEYTGGFNTRFSYKGFTISAQGTYSHGGKKYWGGLASLFRFNSLDIRNKNAYILNRWCDENPDSNLPAVRMGGDEQFSDFYLYDASYIKLQNINLNYNLPKNIVERSKIFAAFSIFANCQNVKTWTDYPGPSVESYSNNSIQGNFIDNGIYPTTRRFQFGFKCTLK